MKRAGLTLVFYLALLWLGGMLLLGSLASLPLVVAPRRWREPFMREMAGRTFQLFLWGCERGGVMETDLTALDALKGTRGLVIVANHPSMIDVFLVVSRLRQCICLMKSSLGSNVFLGIGARLAGYIPNRHVEVMIRQATEVVARGEVLLIFPEGTRTERPPLDALKPGAALIARRAKAPLQTVVIERRSEYLTKGWPIWRPPVFPMRVHARLGPCVQPEATVAATVDRLHAVLLHELTNSPAPLQG